ncbi:heterokaryon incompatibility protein-domain-containing protein [Xylaria venustula]|nr:heterokaryon incompatibility protein-domain-containing protein [Xylaria venustula]
MYFNDLPKAVLCKVCASIFNNNSYERWAKFWQIWRKIHDLPSGDLNGQLPSPGRHHRSWQNCSDARTQGCHICSKLENMAFLSYPLGYYIYFREEESLSRKILCYTLCIDQQLFNIVSSSPRSFSPKSSIQCKGQFWTGDEDIAVAARIWLNNCLKNHATCSKSFATGWKPSRLLDVSNDNIRLVSGDLANIEQHYITLSHCWGKEKFLVLTADLVSLFFAGVHISAFPLTFQETIVTVRRLGIRYLWIDCYCILQGESEDAKTDWKSESLHMGRVYANALLNIGAIESSGPSQGLFRESSPSCGTSSTIVWSPTQRDGAILFRVTKTDRVFFGTPVDELMGSNLMTRGWVLQECIMAPRMLSFAKDKVAWQCSELAASEGVSMWEITSDERSSMWDQPFWLFTTSPTSTYRTPHLDTKSRWISTLEYYCQTCLTYPEKDLFAALDGVGKELAKFSGSRFENGTFASTLLETLLYEPAGLAKADDTTHTELVPMDEDEEPYYIIPDHSSRRDETRPAWHWSSWYPDVRFTLALSNDFPMAYAFTSDDCKLSNPLDQSSTSYWPNLVLIGRLMATPPVSCTVCPDTREEYQNLLTDEARFYLPLFSHAYPGYNSGKKAKYTGLLLERSESGAYRRTGVWDCDVDLEKMENKVMRTRPQLIVLE